jgi:inosine/xanthosine triphosphatase
LLPINALHQCCFFAFQLLPSFPQPQEFFVNFPLKCHYNRLIRCYFEMKKITIAVGSKRGPKLNAVKEALEAFSGVLARETQFEVLGVEVESGVSHTPASREELMRGARQRAEALLEMARRNGAAWQYFVGLEGGLDVIHESALANGMLPPSDLKPRGRRIFLESWAYVSDGAQGHYGRSGSIELPEALAHEVHENGVELSVAIDRFAGAVGIRDAQGAWGVLSNNFITRQEAFRVAVIAAFAPFYNAKMYSAVAAANSQA